MKKNGIVAISGYFDPLHVGHLEYIKISRSLGDFLVVIVNNDHQCSLKKGKAFMKEDDRVEIIKSIKGVDEVVLSVDKDRTVCRTLEIINPDIFANGGDRSNIEIPESEVCRKYNIKLVDGLGNKIRSSSDLTGLKEK
jgi:cytidyltransferase-like protein|tara:strand:+ start:3977 stop:4390 length:414 start_codon:yes stop_codon:yes gene_type:complete